MKQIISLLVRYVPRKYLQRVSGLGLKFLGIFYIGNSVECPICKNHYRKFLPYGRIKTRANALCPGCLSLERHRLIELYLEQKTNFYTTRLKVLHIAPEPCFMKRFQGQHGDGYITADLESPLAKVKMDIHHMPFPENHFDVVLCNHVLEHVDDDILAMSEIRRVLSPGGWSILQVPWFSPVPETTLEDPAITDLRERERLFGQDDHVRKYGRDYLQRIQRAGLRPEGNEFSTTLSDERVRRHGVVKGEVIYLGRK
jgi:SAM-dependent methyltransferase